MTRPPVRPEGLGTRPGLPAAWLDLPAPAVARIAAEAGVSLAVIDREHGAIGVETAAAMTDALVARGVPVLTRVPELATAAVQQALDVGASGVIVPQVEDARAAARAAAAARYAPAGRRGFAGGVIAATGYGVDPGYAGRWNAGALVAVQIESRAGLAAADSIAAVPGVDILFFGPFDYAMDTGLDPATAGEALAGVFARIVVAARQAGCLTGVFPWPGAERAALAAAGADLVIAASDVGLLRRGFEAASG